MPHTTLEQAIEVARTLLPEDQQRLKEWLDEQERGSTDRRARDEELRRKEERFQHALTWLDEHRAEFLNQWVALDGERLLSHGADAKQVYAEARAAGVETPLLHHITEGEMLPFGGW